METLLKPNEVCNILGVTERTLANWRRKEINLKFYRLNTRTIRYSPTEVNAFIERKTTNV